MSRFTPKQYVAEIGLNGASIAEIGAMNTTGSKLTLLKVNTSGVIEKSWREYDAETGVSVRSEYKGQTLAQTKIVELPAELLPFAEAWLQFEAVQIASLKDLTASVKRDALAAYRAAAVGLGAEFGVGEKKLSGRIGDNRATCTVMVTQGAAGAGTFGARVKFFDTVEQDAFATPGFREAKVFATDSEIEVAIGKCVKAISLPAAWAIDKPVEVKTAPVEPAKPAKPAKPA